MKQEVLLSIIGEQQAPDGELNRIELMTEGLLIKEEDCWMIEYEESELSGIEGTTTTLRVEDGCVILHRRGTLMSHCVFEEGRQQQMDYMTDFGCLQISMESTYVHAFEQDGHGKLTLHYRLVLGEMASKNWLKIQF